MKFKKILTFLVLGCLGVAKGQYTPFATFGTTTVAGSATNQFDSPAGVEVAPDGKIFVADQYNNRISVWTQSGNTFGNLTTLGVNSFTRAITIASDGKIYVVNGNGSSVSVWTQSGNTFGNIATFGTGNNGSALNQFNGASGISVAQDGKIFISEQQNQRISVWTQSGNTFGNLTTFGGEGSTLNQLYNPEDVHVSLDGRIYIADYFNHRISIWTQSGNNFGNLTSFGSIGSNANQFMTVTDVTVANDGKIYVCDYGNHRISVWTQSGNTFGNIITFGGLGSSNNKFNGTFGVSVSSEGKVFVSDYANHRISVWQGPQPLSVTSATISGLNAITIAGGSITLTSAFSPSNATFNTTPIWSINTQYRNVATINSITGVLTASDKGNNTGQIEINVIYGTGTNTVLGKHFVSISGQPLKTITGFSDDFTGTPRFDGFWGGPIYPAPSPSNTNEPYVLSDAVYMIFGNGAQLCTTDGTVSDATGTMIWKDAITITSAVGTSAPGFNFCYKLIGKNAAGSTIELPVLATNNTATGTKFVQSWNQATLGVLNCSSNGCTITGQVKSKTLSGCKTAYSFNQANSTDKISLNLYIPPSAQLNNTDPEIQYFGAEYYLNMSMKSHSWDANNKVILDARAAPYIFFKAKNNHPTLPANLGFQINNDPLDIYPVTLQPNSNSEWVISLAGNNLSKISNFNIRLNSGSTLFDGNIEIDDLRIGTYPNTFSDEMTGSYNATTGTFSSTSVFGKYDKSFNGHNISGTNSLVWTSNSTNVWGDYFSIIPNKGQGIDISKNPDLEISLTNNYSGNIVVSIHPNEAPFINAANAKTSEIYLAPGQTSTYKSSLTTLTGGQPFSFKSLDMRVFDNQNGTWWQNTVLTLSGNITIDDVKIGYPVPGTGSVIAPSNLTVTSNAINTPPVLDGLLTDNAWIANPLNNTILNKINKCDGGTSPQNQPPATMPGSNFNERSASFSTTWDNDYLYVAIEVTDPDVVAGVSTVSSIDMFFNNGNGRSAHPNITTSFPRAYNYARDVQFIFRTGTNATSATTSNAMTYANAGLYSYDYQFTDNDIKAVVRKTATGYVMEARFDWKKINREFVNSITGLYTDLSKLPSQSRIPLGFDIAVNYKNTTSLQCGNIGDSNVQLMWNQCCYNRNWTESQYFGHLKLGGVPPQLVTTASISGSNQITVVGGTQQMTASYLPSNANFGTSFTGWSVSPTSIATISGTGLLQALANGNVTVTGSYGTISASKIITISGQCSPFDIQFIGNTGFCKNQKVTLTASGANTYTWSNGSENGTSNIASFSPSQSGEITFTGTDLQGCKSIVVVPFYSSETIIVEQPQDIAFITGNIASIRVVAGGSNLSWLWSNGATTEGITTSIPGIYQVTVSGSCGILISRAATITKSTNSYTFIPTVIEMSVGDTLSIDVKTQANAPLVYTINDNTIAKLTGSQLVGLKAGSAIVSVSQPSTTNSDALPTVTIPVNVSSTAGRNFDIIGSILVPTGAIIIYSQPSVSGYTYSWSFAGTGLIVVAGTETTADFQVIFLSNASPVTIICIVKDKNQNIVSNKSLRVNTLSNEEAEIAKNLPKVDCPTEVTDCKNAYITSVKIGKLNNENTGCSRAGFGDYTLGTKLDSLLMGEAYDLSLASQTYQGKSAFFAVWIDYNNNGKFTDQDDFVAASFENSASFSIKNIIIKNQNEYEGPRRLRVSMRADAAIAPSDPCAKTGGSGETEDYLVFIRKPDDLLGATFVSPNKDGKNDYLFIQGINPKESNKLTIMDKQGNMIYEKENYQNDWDGVDNKNKAIGDNTYYYYFRNGKKTINSFVELRRK